MTEESRNEPLAHERRLVAIMFTDVVGYSARVQRDERKTLELVKADFARIAELVAKHGGEVLETMGDGMLLCFPSAVQAVACALQVQAEFNRRRERHPEEEALEHRVGIHVGDVLRHGGHVSGDGANIAARLQAKAPAGGICVSQMVRDTIRGKLAFQEKFLGPQTLKNIAEPVNVYFVAASGTAMPVTPEPRRRWWLVAAAVVVVLAGSAVFFWPVPAPVAPPAVKPPVPALFASLVPDKSVAVLAFTNLSDDKGNEYFSDGVTEELLNVLAKVPGLKVSARTSAFYFKGKEIPIPEIAKKLGVAYVVEGSVRKSGDRVRITAQLIKAADGFHLWSETFTRDLKDIFAVQDEIAGLIAKNLQLKMGVGSSNAAVVNPEAYQLLLQARFFSWRFDNEGWQKSVEECKAALAIDPDFALAAAEMARSYIHLARFGGIRLADGFAAARPAAERAMALNPELPEALNAMAWVQRTADWDFAGADASFRRAYELAPHNAAMITDYAVMRNNLGHFDEAIALERRAIELDPLNSSPYSYLSMFLAWAGRIDEAVKAMQHGVELAPAATEWHSYLARYLVLQGRLNEAAEVAEQEPSERYRLYARALVQLARKNQPEADRLRKELIDKYGDELAFFIAENYAYAGEVDLAFEWLERSRVQHETNVIWVMGQPTFRILRSDPRWPAFLKKMGFDVPQTRP